MIVRASGKPRKSFRAKVKAKDIKHAIDQAKLLCFNFEDTVECRLAWEKVEELSSSYHDQWLHEVRTRRHEEEAALDEERRVSMSLREYDV